MLFYFNGGIGYYLPVSRQHALKDVGSATSFQFQVDYKTHYFARFIFDQYNVSVKAQFNRHGTNHSISAKMPTTAIGLDAGYQWQFGRLSTYVYMGASVATTDAPYLAIDSDANSAKLSSRSATSMAIRTGLGINYKFNRYFILYFEPQFLSFPLKTQFYDGQMDGVSLQIGFKTPLQ
jgi:hypothetical protein